MDIFFIYAPLLIYYCYYYTNLYTDYMLRTLYTFCITLIFSIFNTFIFDGGIDEDIRKKSIYYSIAIIIFSTITAYFFPNLLFELFTARFFTEITDYIFLL
jgi:hypothetical protein